MERRGAVSPASDRPGVALTLLLTLLTLPACGGAAVEQEAGSQAAPGTGSESAEASAAETEAPAKADQETAVAGDGPLLTEVPDPCEYLTQGDVEELLDAPAGAGASLDAGGWNCVYDTDGPRRRLVLNMHVGRDLSVESTQIGMTIEACGAEVVRPFDDLGVDSALYRSAGDRCGGGEFLWVVASAKFQGSLRPGERELSGPVHFTVSARSEGEAVDVSVLRAAAERVLEELAG